jgi:polar amino acid transport system substrate-binding protein
MISRLQRVLGLVLFASLLVGAHPALGATLVVGSDISHPPLESFAPGQKMVGLDIDLIQAVGARLHMPVKIENHPFPDLIPGVQSGHFSVALAGIFDTRVREQQVDMVDYLYAGSGLLVPKGNPKHIFSLDSLCGRTVDLETGTLQDAETKQQSTDCQAQHLGAVNILEFSNDVDSLKAFTSGKSDAHIADFPVVAYLAKTLGGGTKYELGGPPFKVVLYGIVVSKKNPALRVAVQNALKSIVADGTYDKLLAKWGLTQSALRSIPVNAGTLFQH